MGKVVIGGAALADVRSRGGASYFSLTRRAEDCGLGRLLSDLVTSLLLEVWREGLGAIEGGGGAGRGGGGGGGSGSGKVG